MGRNVVKCVGNIYFVEAPLEKLHFSAVCPSFQLALNNMHVLSYLQSIHNKNYIIQEYACNIANM